MDNSLQEEKWVRRGHSRKPNKFVLGLYSMFDTIQDFGPMFSSMGRGIGKASSTTWGFFARSIMLFINFVLVVGIIYLSVGHSYTLLTRSGFSGIAAWVAVAVWEAVFIYCSMLIDNAHRNQRKVGWASWIGFLFGFAFVVISNYMGMADNTIGKIIGISTPILLLVMKKVLEHQFKNEPAEKQKNATWFSSVFKSKTDEKIDQIVEENLEIKTPKLITLDDEIKDEIPIEEITEKTDVEIEKNEPVEQEQLGEKYEPTIDQLEDQNTPQIADENNEEKVSEKVDETIPEKMVEKNENKNEDKPKRRKRSRGRKKGQKNNKKTNVNYDQILAIAKQLKNDEKIDAEQLEKEIEKEANCSRYFAKKALAELEQKMGEKSEEKSNVKEEVFDEKNERKLYLA